MADYNQLKASIAAVIKTNNRKEITGQLLQNVLFQMTEVIGENYQLAGFATPQTNPHEPDQNVFYITDESGTFPYFDNIILGSGISFLMWKNGQWTSHTVNGVTQEWVRENFISKEYFRSLFRAYDANGDEILPNNDPEGTLPAVVDNIKAMVGFWTEQYISALGHGTGGGGGGGGGGATTLDGLDDVVILNPQNGQGLIFDSTSGKWINQNIPTGTDMATVWTALAGATNQQINISHLTDALATYATQTWVGQNYISIAYFDRLFRAYNGSTLVSHNDTTSTIDNIKAMFGFWTEFYVSALGIGGLQSPISLASLNDIALTTPITDGEMLVYDAVNHKWKNTTLSFSSDLASLTDVTLTSLQNGQTLLYDSTTSKWYNSALKTINGQSLLGSGDISVGGGASGNYLPLTGGTMLGDISFNNSNITYSMTWLTGGVIRALMGYYPPADIVYVSHNYGNIQLRLTNTGVFSVVDIPTDSDKFSIDRTGLIKIYNCPRVYSAMLLPCFVNNNSLQGIGHIYLTDLLSDYMTGYIPKGGLTNVNAGDITWGTLTPQNGYTTLMHWYTPSPTANVGAYGFACANGQAFLQVDGFFYQNEGNYRVYDVSGGTINGSVYATGAVTALSDIRRKDVQDFDIGLTVEKVAEAPTIRFLWKDKKDDGMQVGSIAQFWQSALPEVVRTEDDGNLSLQYGVAALVSAIVTARKVVDHERRISGLERENERLRTEVEQLRLN